MDKELLEVPANYIHLPDGSNKWDRFLIGGGGFAHVYLVRIRLPNDVDKKEEPAAFKKYKHNKDEQGSHELLSQLRREANLLNNISHENIIQLKGVCFDDMHIGILLELCEGGTLGMLCRRLKQKSVNIKVSTDWALQIANGMKYLAERDLLHRNLKGDNILVKQEVCLCPNSAVNPGEQCEECHHRPMNKLQLKIQLGNYATSISNVQHFFVGTPHWMAPEICNGTQENDWLDLADVWSYGVVLWEILARGSPANGKKLDERWPEEWKSIMKQCWSVKPKHRPSFEFLSEYFSSYYETLDGSERIKKPRFKAGLFACFRR